MLGSWKAMPAIARGDWRTKVLHLAQVCVGIVAVLGFFAFVLKWPLLILAFASAMGLLVVGVVLFALVALLAQRTLVEEEFGPGETIFLQGDVGRHVYVIKTGNVEVVHTKPGGISEVLKVLGPGDHFGEMALLGRAPRNATIRTTSEVRVFKMSAGNFAALYTTLPGVREQFSKVMESRLEEIRRSETRA
ncbi:MAG TPA: cyclic nucleotide-binding domain-containing protein [Terriglobales bacterium]|nr:cyclic nucleotide-binding domain-containing protein [Terriglobales bacterium]